MNLPFFVDLCGSDDEKVPGIIDLESGDSIIPIPSVARAPIVSLLSDDDDDDDDVEIIPSKPRRKRRRATKNRRPAPGFPASTATVEMDSKPAAKATKNNNHNHNTSNNSTTTAPPCFSQGDLDGIFEVRTAPTLTTATTPLLSVYEVFPDVDRVHAQKLLFETHNNVDTVLSVLAEGNYPKNKTRKVATASGATSSSSIMLVKRTRDLPKFDYLSPNSFEPTVVYMRQAIQQLLYQFPFLSQFGVKRLMLQHKHHYSMVRQFVLNALMAKSNNNNNKKASEEEEETQYYALKTVLASKKPNKEQLERLGVGNTVKHRRNTKIAPTVTDPILFDEIKHATQQLTAQMTIVEQRLKRLQARKVSQQTGTAMECACCFDQVAIEEMVACRDEGHLFCVDCIQRYAESQIFSSGNLGTNKKTGKPALELLCCHGDGCQSAFQEVHLQKALPYKTLEKYNELQFQAAMDLAGIRQDLCTCPKCGFQADLPETQMIFLCPMEDCQFESCRKCGREPHIPLRCDEVAKQTRQDEGRLKVEEAITLAKIRKCPKCKTSFLKSDGCNKMTCPCGVRMCYICQQEVPKTDPYAHFCQKPHCDHKKCKKCTLYSNAEEDDVRAMRQAGMGAAEDYRNALRNDNDNQSNADDVHIDVETILKAR